MKFPLLINCFEFCLWRGCLTSWWGYYDRVNTILLYFIVVECEFVLYKHVMRKGFLNHNIHMYIFISKTMNYLLLQQFVDRNGERKTENVNIKKKVLPYNLIKFFVYTL